MAYVYQNASLTAARLAGDDPEMDFVANRLLGLARANAVRHILTGDYIRKLSVKNVPGKKGVRDRLVIAGDKAAISIEYGHTVMVRKAGKNMPNFKWVPGQFILTKSIAQIPGTRRNSFGRIR